MDSGNSGSLQSSSGGDEEYDSRAAASLFMTPHPDSHSGGLSAPPPPLFDPISNYMEILHQNPNPSFLNPNTAWLRPVPPRSDPNPSASLDFNPLLSGSSDFQPPPNNGYPGGSAAGQNPHQAAPRNPKKRSRASRRAPTTVLTTDTANFRAMVQEFTGIPSPPFNSSPFPRGRFDIFGARSAVDPLSPLYLRRPFPQKAQSPPPFLASSNNNCSNPSNSSDQFNFPNPLLNSLLLQSNPKFLFSSSPMASSKPNPSNSFEIPPNGTKIDGLDGFGLSSGNHVTSSLTGLPNLISGDQIGAVHHDGSTNANHQAQIRAVNGGCSFPNGKMNMAASSSDSRRPGNVGNREGTVESWICSSE